jgi:hypothetical protein
VTVGLTPRALLVCLSILLHVGMACGGREEKVSDELDANGWSRGVRDVGLGWAVQAVVWPLSVVLLACCGCLRHSQSRGKIKIVQSCLHDLPAIIKCTRAWMVALRNHVGCALSRRAARSGVGTCAHERTDWGCEPQRVCTRGREREREVQPDRGLCVLHATEEHS